MPINPATCPVGRKYTYHPNFIAGDYSNLDNVTILPDLSKIVGDSLSTTKHVSLEVESGNTNAFCFIEVTFYARKVLFINRMGMGSESGGGVHGGLEFQTSTFSHVNDFNMRIALPAGERFQIPEFEDLPDSVSYRAKINVLVDNVNVTTRVYGDLSFEGGNLISTFDETRPGVNSSTFRYPVMLNNVGVGNPFTVHQLYYYADQHVGTPCEGPTPTSSILLPESTAKPSYVRMLRGGRTLAEAKYFHEIMKRKNS